MTSLSAQSRLASSSKTLERLGFCSPSTHTSIRPQNLIKMHRNYLHYVRNKTPNILLTKNYLTTVNQQ